MSHVNLLPWREQRRQQGKQQYLVTLVLVALLTGLLFWAIGQVIDQQIANQNARNQYLKREIALLDSQIAEIKKIRESKNAIEQRMALIEQLQSSRNIAPQIFDELARIVPPGVSFTTMQRTGSQISINGSSDSNNRLSEFMRRLDSSTVFANGEISTIVADTSTTESVSDFQLKFSISERLLSAMGTPSKGAEQ